MTRVFPLPAPARTRSGPSVRTTASCWAGLSPARSGSGPAVLALGVVSVMGAADLIVPRPPRSGLPERASAVPRRQDRPESAETCPGSGRPLLDGDALGQVARLVDVAAPPDGH